MYLYVGTTTSTYMYGYSANEGSEKKNGVKE